MWQLYKIAHGRSSNTPEGLTPFDRMKNSPNTEKNILNQDFGKLGIGVIDTGVYGKMFVREFTN